jgi:hypothetical protein
MFKYLSDILSKFTPQQRLLALVLLLFTAVLLGLGGKVIDSFNQSDEVLKGRVSQLQSSQKILSDANDSLAYIITQNQIQCVRDISDVRNKILEDLGILERNLQQTMNQQSVEPQYYTTTHEEYVPHIETEVQRVERSEVREMPVMMMTQSKPKRSFAVGARPNTMERQLITQIDTIRMYDEIVTEKVVMDTIMVTDTIMVIEPTSDNTSQIMLNQIRDLKSKIKNDNE